jgi:hypothetical protein
MNRVEKILELLICPPRNIRIICGLYGAGYWYLDSKSKKDRYYEKEVPKKLHILPAVIGGGISACLPILPVTMFSVLSIDYLHDKYRSWKYNVIYEQKQG